MSLKTNNCTHLRCPGFLFGYRLSLNWQTNLYLFYFLIVNFLYTTWVIMVSCCFTLSFNTGLHIITSLTSGWHFTIYTKPSEKVLRGKSERTTYFARQLNGTKLQKKEMIWEINRRSLWNINSLLYLNKLALTYYRIWAWSTNLLVFNFESWA